MKLDSFLDKISMNNLRQIEDSESSYNLWGIVIVVIGWLYWGLTPL